MTDTSWYDSTATFLHAVPLSEWDREPPPTSGAIKRLHVFAPLAGPYAADDRNPKYATTAVHALNAHVGDVVIDQGAIPDSGSATRVYVIDKISEQQYVIHNPATRVRFALLRLIHETPSESMQHLLESPAPWADPA